MKRPLSAPTISEEDVFKILKNYKSDSISGSLLYFVSELLDLSVDSIMELLYDR